MVNVEGKFLQNFIKAEAFPNQHFTYVYEHGWNNTVNAGIFFTSSASFNDIVWPAKYMNEKLYERQMWYFMPLPLGAGGIKN